MSYEVRYTAVDPHFLNPLRSPAVVQATESRFTAYIDRRYINPELLTPLSDVSTDLMDQLVPRAVPLNPSAARPVRVIRQSGLIVVPQVDIEETGIILIVPESGIAAELAAVLGASGTYLNRYFDIKP